MKIKILSGWSNKGGSTFAFIRLTNELNKIGYDTTFYGAHEWHLDKCKSDLLKNYIPNKEDVVIIHFLTLKERLNVKRVILSCHEKNVFEVGNIKPFWDFIIFLNEKQRKYHYKYRGDYDIIPNLRENLEKKKKSPEAINVAGIIGSIDKNKQTHVSIKRALSEGFNKIYLFGTINDPHYYLDKVKPLLSDKVIEFGFIEDKQKMYDMVEAVFLSSKSEVASLVKDECETTNTRFYGNDATIHDGELLSNKEILERWIENFEL